MTTDTSVKFFESTMSGAPTLANNAGDLIALLDACLINGFGSVTLNSLVIADNVATATVSGGHNFSLYGATGPVITISGATPSGLNGEWRIQTVSSSTVFTFSTNGISNQTATGTISAKRSPAGFSKAFSGTNLAAYRANSLQSNRLYFRIDDTGTANARICGYETMSDVNTGTGLFPTEAQISGGGYIHKSNSSSTRNWVLFSDGLMIYFISDPAGNATFNGSFAFGDILSYAASDAYNTTIITINVANNSSYIYSLGNTASSYLARSYAQTGESITSARFSHGKTSSCGSGGQTYPASVDNCLHIWPVECWESTTLARGMMPGFWNPIHASDAPHGSFIDDIEGLPGRTIRINTVATGTYECAFDVTGPWR